MEIRSYASTDAQATLDVFLSAVTGTASVHYSTTQIAAWSRPDDRDLVEWNSVRQALNTFVAMVDGHIAGFRYPGHCSGFFLAWRSALPPP